ncbi:lipopolysaccharide biosynthesis protein RfbH [Anaeromicrobium sediminis]|uniref:Lipopolysaccharide biosynthesis protein RfbH n=1 Tax=Anaeromicrobium sediminis TaxID=1478221 RepID=A0A267MMI9_9FIRM|nr:lipopolysaccharide biosynthesis protein RfbH [Anaeromicrobium sediminis]PAB60647.1 lipopolysaccharide biosynthesis protein RfbH [Anaeromicrobium sediminis]
MKTEQTIRNEIVNRVVEIYKIRKSKEGFIPGKTKIHYSGRVFDENEMVALIDSALDFWLTLGKEGRKFINDFTKYMNMQYGLVTNSGSSANLVALSALCSPNIENPIKPGDEVITTAMAFPTTFNPIIQNNLTPVLIDVEEGTYNIDASKIKAAISDKTRAIVFAHTLGNPAEMDKIIQIAKKYNLYIIEDTCDALDSKYDNKLCGTFGDFSTYSFYAAHHMTMGEGGAILTNNINLYKQALSIRDWGRACYCQTGESNPNGVCGKRFKHKYENLPYGYDHKYVYTNIGYNLKPLDIQCAIGIEQLKKLPAFTEKRKYNFNILYNFFKKYEDKFILPITLPKADPSWFSFPLTIRKNSGFTRKDLVTYLEDNMIETRMLFTGNILKHPAYKHIDYRIADKLNNTDNVLTNTFFLGIYPGLTEDMLQYIIDVTDRFMTKFN